MSTLMSTLMSTPTPTPTPTSTSAQTDLEDDDSSNATGTGASDFARLTLNQTDQRTVLPAPIARAVSLATRSSCLAIRVGAYVGSYGFDAARVTTLSSLELGRGILEGILTRAGRETLFRSGSDLARADAETVLARSLENLHRAMSHVVFWTTAGFHVTGTTLSMVSDVSQLLLSSLDQFFGSTDSSRAIASIITLIRREFQNPATGSDGQHVGVVDLVMGLCALAYLQRKSWRIRDQETRRLGHDEIVWDVVVLNDGERIDVHQDSLYGIHRSSQPSVEPAAANSTSPTQRTPSLLRSLDLQPREDDEGTDGEDDEYAPETRLQKQIMQSLPADTTVSITTSTVTQKTITVDFKGPSPPILSPPAGVEVLEKEIVPAVHVQDGDASSTPILTYRVVYRINKTKMRSLSCQGHDELVTPDPSPSPAVNTDTLDNVQVLDNRPSLETETNNDTDTDTETLPSSPRQDTPNTPAPLPRLQLSAASPPDNTRGSISASRVRPSKLPPAGSSRQAEAKVPVENAPNQKRQRTPLGPLDSAQRPENKRLERSDTVKPVRPGPTAVKKEGSSTSTQKKTGIRQALKRAPGSNLSTLWHKDSSNSRSSLSLGKAKEQDRPPLPPKSPRTSGYAGRQLQTRATGPTIASHLRDRGGGSGSTATAAASSPGVPRSPSRASYISVHEQRRSSIVSLTDTYSIHSMDGQRPSSPLFFQQHEPKPQSRGLFNVQLQDDDEDVPSSPRTLTRNPAMHKRNTPSLSLYSIKTSGSQASLILSSMHPKSAYTDSEAIDTLRRAGTLGGIFPPFHLLRNVTRFMRFSSASYGSHFLKVMGMGISREMSLPRVLDDTHHEIQSFSHHTGLEANSILLASFVDPQGGSDTTGSTGTGVPLVHYIALDHESKAVVLACRGTLGFEDVLADLACEYDDLIWRGKSYKVHKGIHASARRLLYGGDGRVLYTLKEALDEFADYGLVLCGHSLGGGVTSLLGTMLAEPSPTGLGFVTSAEPHRRLLTNTSDSDPGTHVCLPPGRSIHVYSYGPPGTMSPPLRKATRGLITSTVHGCDLVPFLSLGILHDFQAVAFAFKNDGGSGESGGGPGSKLDVKRRIWEGCQTGLSDAWYANNTGGRATVESGEEAWASSAMHILRSSMASAKLVPPGEVFVVESSRVLRRDAFMLGSEGDMLGRPAQRVVFKYVRDVEARFREVRFGTSMLMDHSPANYEEALAKLRLGVTDSL